MANQRTYTNDEKKALVEEIRRRYMAGEGSLSAIAKSVGITDTSYHNWRRLKDAKSRPRRRGAYEPAERERLLSRINQMRAEGKSIEAACRFVGISETSYDTWRKRVSNSSMRPVQVTALVPTASQALTIIAPAHPPERTSLSLTAPGGYRVEGLDVDTAAALLRALA